MAEPFLSIQHVKKSFGTTTVVQDFNLDVGTGEFVSFLGPSGCGKTTVLRMVAGFEEPTAGSIVVAGKDVTRLKPNQRNIGMVFQAYALFPNLTVAQNIGFGLKVAGMPRADADKRVAEMLDLIKLPQFGDRYPYQLSGGQQQRVALARALAPKPKLLLLDEPLSALDARCRVSLREEIRAIQKSLGITDDLRDARPGRGAVDLRSHRGHVWRQGRAAGTPFEIYNRPASKFVANFVGTLNVLEGTVTDAPSGRVRVNAQDISIKEKLNGSKTGDQLSLALRPEAITLGRQPGRDTSLAGEIREVHFWARSSASGSASAPAWFRSIRSTTRPRRPRSSVTRPTSASLRATCSFCTDVRAHRTAPADQRLSLRCSRPYNRAMKRSDADEIADWLAEAGLLGLRDEAALAQGFASAAWPPACRSARPS